MDWKDIITKQGPQAIMALVAAKQAGPDGYANFMRGIRVAQEQKQQLSRQEMLDARAGDMHRAQLDNMKADNARRSQGVEIDRWNGVLEQIDRETRRQADLGVDAPSAENAILQRSAQAATAAGFEPDQFTGLVPNMAPAIDKGAKSDARTLLDELAASGRRNKQTFDDNVSIVWERMTPRLRRALVSMGHTEGQPVKPSQVEQIFGFVLPEAPPPVVRPRSDFDEFFEQEYLPASEEERDANGFVDPLTASERRDLRLKAREAWNRSGAVGTAAGRPRPASRTGLTPTQRLSVLRDRVYAAIVNDARVDSTLLNELSAAGLDPVAEEQKARQKYEAALSAAERRLRPVQGRYGEPEDPAAIEARRERARQLLRGGRGGQSGPARGAGAAPSSGQSVTSAEIRAVAQKLGITEQEARDAYRTRNFLIVE